MSNLTILIPSTPERRERRQKCIDSINETIPYEVKVYESEGEGWVKAVHKGLENVDGLVVIVGDDMTFEKDTFKILSETFWRYFPDGFGLAQPYNEINNGELAVCPMALASTLREFIHKGYVHNFSDTELTYRMNELGKYIYVPEAVVHHNHFINKKAEMDETYKKNSESYEQDKELYIQRVCS